MKELEKGRWNLAERRHERREMWRRRKGSHGEEKAQDGERIRRRG